MYVGRATAHELAQAESALTPAERAAVPELSGELRRTEWLAARLAAKRAVAAALDLAHLTRIAIDSFEGGAPQARYCGGGEPEALPVALSLTHAEGRAVAAARRHGRVGVDLEPMRAIPESALRFFVSARERSSAELTALAWWVLKEAAWKALGLGRAEPFCSLELVFERGRLTALRHGERLVPASGAFAEPWPGYLLATVALPELQ